jgi:hypothetical protein
VCDSRLLQSHATPPCNHSYLGTFFSPVEAALAIARHLGPQDCARRLEAQRRVKGRQMSKEEALTAAAAEGLTLEPPRPGHGRREYGSRATPYHGVACVGDSCGSRPYRATITERVDGGDGEETEWRKRFVGHFATAEQAALEIARLRRARDAAERDVSHS